MIANRRQKGRAPAWPSSAPAGSATAEPTETQRRLLTAALALFSERGYEGTSTAEIAKKAGVAEKTLFANFGSKEKLYQATLGPASLRVLFISEAARTLLPVLEHPEPDPRDLLRAVVGNRVRFGRAHASELRLIVQHLLARPDGISVFLDTFGERLWPIIEGILARLVRTGGLRADIPAPTILRLILTQAVGYVLTRTLFLPDADWDDDREVDTLVSVLLDGLRPRVGPKSKSAQQAKSRRRQPKA